MKPHCVSIGLLLVANCYHSAMAQSNGLRQPPPRQPVEVARSSDGMVVSETPLASAVGRGVLAHGGNAVDAAVAVGIALQVTWPEAGNIGGGGFMLMAPADGEVQCIDYRETAPGSVTESSLESMTDTRDIRFVGTPGTLAGLELAHRQWGRLNWADLIAPSVRLAAEGFIVDRHLAHSLNDCLANPAVQRDEKCAELRRVYGGPHDGLWKAGDRLVQPDLAITLQKIADEGSRYFYEGDLADAVVDEMQSRGGWIDHQDLREYQAIVRQPVVGTFNGYEIIGMPMPSSGGNIVQMQLSMIQQLGLMPRTSSEEKDWTVDEIHLIVETMRRAFRERAEFLGDSDFVTIPGNFLLPQRVDSILATIDRQKATPSASIAGDLVLATGPVESEQTTHFSIVDADGMAVSNTYTLEQNFGSRIVVRGTGVLLNNEMGDFGWKPGVTNADGMVGTKPNRVAPHKRMLSSMSPTIVKKDGQLRMVVGSPGSRSIINTVTLVLVRRLLFDQSLADSVDAPRFHHQWFPDVIRFESGDSQPSEQVIAELVRRGHRVELTERYLQGSAHSIEADPLTGDLIGVADWRRGGAARAVKISRTVAPTTIP